MEASKPNPEQVPLTGAGHPGMGVHAGKGYSQMAAPYIYPWSFMWFGAAFCVMVGAMVSFISEVLSLEWIDALEMAYIFFFGLLLAIVDTPLFTSVNLVTHIRQGTNRFCAILTRVTGKGVVYMFLGCTLWSSMWTNLEGGFLLFLAFFLGIFIFLTGIISVILGIIKSRNLNAVRNELKKDGIKLQDEYDKHARMYASTGLTPEEFERMSMALPNGVRFEGSDLKLVFAGVSSDPNKMFISLQDLNQWVMGGMIFI